MRIKNLFNNFVSKDILFFYTCLLAIAFALLSIYSTNWSSPVKFAGSSVVFIAVSIVIKLLK